MMKTIFPFSLAALALLVGAGGMAATGNADDHRGYDRRGPVNVVVVEKQVVRIQPQPVRVVQAPMRGGLFDRLDINNNNVVNHWEFTQRYGDSRRANRVFSRMDTNRSGTLSMREVAAGRDMLMDMRMRG